MYFAALISATSSLGYVLPVLIGLESMGVPSPGETALVLAAILASQGQLNIELVIAIAIASAIAGDNLGYLLGRRLGREALTSHGPFHERRAQILDIGDRYFAKHGAKTVFIGRWIALIRFATAWLAGINRMEFRIFFFWNALGGITWAITYGVVGYYGGEAVAQVLERVGVIAAAVLVVVLVGAFAFARIREHRRGHSQEQNAERDEHERGGTDEPARVEVRSDEQARGGSDDRDRVDTGSDERDRPAAEDERPGGGGARPRSEPSAER